MAREFTVPDFYRSSLITRIKTARKALDPRRLDYSPALLDLGRLRFKIARQFGFCFGVENAIEIAYRAVAENPDRRVFLLGEMIHNPQVNGDLQARGVRFILSPQGEQLIAFDQLDAGDLVIIPAFGTTLELLSELKSRGVQPELYDTTCPFVEKVWRRAAQLGADGFTIVIHGKQAHEETRATFSRSMQSGPSIVIRDREEALELASFIDGSRSEQEFAEIFRDRCSDGFSFARDLGRLGVVNQTTMLAGETEAIGQILKEALSRRWGEKEVSQRFADTRDTLCYATTENQQAVLGMLAAGGNLAIIVGGYNSSNTGHLAELCRRQLPTFHIKDAGEILSAGQIRHLDKTSGRVVESADWLPWSGGQPCEILISAGASCPDALVDEVLRRISCLCGQAEELESACRRCISGLKTYGESGT